MFARFDASKSTKGASKLRRDLINAEIANLRDLLPLPPSTRQRLSQLQLMALVCVYVRKANYFQQAFKRHDISVTQAPTPNIGFSKALSGFLMMMTQNGKLLYISDNAAEYLGHSMEDLLIHGDSVYDIIDKQDHEIIQLELGRIAAHESLIGADETSATLINDCRMFLCRMNVSRNSRRQLRFGDQKVVLVRGHYLSFLPLCSRNEPVFLATCTPIAMPETRECVVLGATNVFTSIHSMDMKFMHIDKNGEFHLEYTKNEIQGISWYKLLHWEYIREAQTKHKLITQNEQDRSCILLVKLQTRTGEWLWVHCVLQVKENMENNQQPVIVCTNQVLSDHEAGVMHTNGWLYHNYMVHNKLQYGLSGYDAHTSSRVIAYYHHNNPTTTVVSPSSTVVPILHCTNSSEIPPTSYTSRSERNQNQYNTNLQHHHQYQSTYVHNTIYPTSLPQYGAPNEHHDGHINSKAVFSHQQKNLNSPRTEVEPVDYSVHNNTTSIINNNHIINDRTASNYQQTEAEFQARSPSTTSYNNNNNNYYKRNKLLANNVTVTNPAAITTILDFEPLKINQSEQVIMDMDQFSQADGILLMPPATYRSNRLQKTFFNTTNRARLMLRADPADFIEQWNPSPPWTDSSQPKVTDVTTPHQHHHQDTSPPVTPTVSYSPQTARAAFTFDLIQEDHDEYLVQKHTSVIPNRSNQTSDGENINNRISQNNESLNYSYTTTTSAIRSITTISPLVSNHASGDTMYVRPPTPLPYVSERQVTHSEPSPKSV